jgi:hypothetical protein
MEPSSLAAATAEIVRARLAWEAAQDRELAARRDVSQAWRRYLSALADGRDACRKYGIGTEVLP